MYESDNKMVSHPSHYNRGKFEVIDIIEEFTKDLSGIEATDTGNVIKYILRWNHKNGLEDLEKAAWYLDHLINKIKEKKCEVDTFSDGKHKDLPEYSNQTRENPTS